MKEEVARTKICPHMAKPISIQLETDNWDFCRGSECMAWDDGYKYQTYNGKLTNEQYEESGVKNRDIPACLKDGCCTKR